jgi:hypothetical protein
MSKVMLKDMAGGGEVAAQIGEAFTKAVIGRKHELEATAGNSGQT